MTNGLVIVEPSKGLLAPTARIEELLQIADMTTEIITKWLKPGVDYGTHRGGSRPTLLKPGAEKICKSFGAIAEFEIIEKETDHDRLNHYAKHGKELTSYGLYRYVVKCNLSVAGRIVGNALGSASTSEAKYIDRPRDLENTVLKMATKRAFVAATNLVFGLSDQFTQDMEDEAHQSSTYDRGVGDHPVAPAQRPTTPPLVLFNFALDTHKERLAKLVDASDLSDLIKPDTNILYEIGNLMHGKPMSKGSFDEVIESMRSANAIPAN